MIFLYLGLQSLMDMEKEGLSGAPTEVALPCTEGHLLPPNYPSQGKQAWALPEQLWRLGTVAVAIFIHELASQ